MLAGGREGIAPTAVKNKPNFFLRLLSLGPLWPLACGVLVRKEWSCLSSLHISQCPFYHLPAGLRGVRSVLTYKKENCLFLFLFWESYQPGKLVRTLTLIVLNSNEICHAWEKGVILITASAWDSHGPEASCRAAAVRAAAAVRRGRIANLLIFKLTPALMGFWFSLGTALKFLVTKV